MCFSLLLEKNVHACVVNKGALSGLPPPVMRVTCTPRPGWSSFHLQTSPIHPYGQLGRRHKPNTPVATLEDEPKLGLFPLFNRSSEKLPRHTTIRFI